MFRFSYHVNKADPDERCFGISRSFVKGWKTIFLFLYYYDIELHWQAKDYWLIRETTMRGKPAKFYTKNPKYLN